MGNEQSANAAPTDQTLSKASNEACTSIPGTTASDHDQPTMTRSRSVRKRLETPSSSLKKKHQYIPRMDRHKNGLVMPTYGNNVHPPTSVPGEYSPQYGFYVNLTPPSPGMYASSTTSMASTAASSTGTSEDSPTITTQKASQPQRPPNPIFQGLVLRQQQQQYAKGRTTETACFPAAPL